MDLTGPGGEKPVPGWLYWIGAAFVGMCAIATYVTYEELSNLDPKNQGAVSIDVGAWGIAIALAGFGVTWYTLYRTATSTEAVRLAVQRIKGDFRSVDLLSELQSSRDAIASIREHLLANSWPSSSGGYNRLRAHLAKVTTFSSVLEHDAIETLKDYTAKSIEAGSYLISLSADTNPPWHVMDSDLQILDNMLIAIESDLRSNLGEQ